MSFTHRAPRFGHTEVVGESGFHCRRHGEYVRPAGRVDLWREFPNDDDSYDRFLRGAPYHQDQFTGHDEGDVVELELVAERFNPHDINAVAAVLATVGAEATRTDADTQRVSVSVTGGAAQLSTVVRMLDEQNLIVDDIGLRRPTLDEVFLALTGQPIESTDDAAA